VDFDVDFLSFRCSLSDGNAPETANVAGIPLVVARELYFLRGMMPDKTAAGTKMCADKCSAQEVWLERLTTGTVGLCRKSYGSLGKINSKIRSSHMLLQYCRRRNP